MSDPYFDRMNGKVIIPVTDSLATFGIIEMKEIQYLFT